MSFEILTDIKYENLNDHEKRIFRKGVLHGRESTLFRTLAHILDNIVYDVKIDEEHLCWLMLQPLNFIREFNFPDLPQLTIEDIIGTVPFIGSPLEGEIRKSIDDKKLAIEKYKARKGEK